MGIVSGGGGGGSSPVICVLLAPALNVSSIGTYPLLYSALEDNVWDETPLAAIPAGLGMTFAFNGTSNTLTTTAAGTWALSVTLRGIEQDASWLGEYNDGLWGTSVIDGATYGGLSHIPSLIVATVMPLPSGAQLAPAINTLIAAALAQTFDASLILARLA